MKGDVVVENVSLAPGSEETTIEIKRGVVTRIGKDLGREVAVVVDGSRLWATPGFVDLQINGAVGSDLSSDPGSVWNVGEALCSHGVVGFAPTLVSPSLEQVDVLSQLLSDGPPPDYAGAKPLGIHVEGPFIARSARGAHRESALIAPRKDLVERLARIPHVAVVTLAPELPDALQAVGVLSNAGIVVALGHSHAGAAQASDAIAWGAKMATHVPNAMEPLSGRDPGVVGAVLDEPDVTISVIVDRVHVDDRVVRMLWRLKGPSSFVLVTDAMAAQGCGDGTFDLSGVPVTVTDGVARTQSGALAGSTVTLDQAVRNLVSVVGASPAEAVRVVSENPNQLLGRSAPSQVANGQSADLVLLDDNLVPAVTIVDGHPVFDLTQDRVRCLADVDLDQAGRS